MEHLEQFHNIIANLLKNSGNAEREAADVQYNEVPGNQRALLLYQLGIDKSVAAEVRCLSFNLLKDLVIVMPNELKDNLIQFVINEKNALLRERIAHVLSDIARHTIDDDGVQQWKPIIPFIIHCASGANGANDGLREIAMILIENVPNIFGANKNDLIGDIKQMFKTSLLFNNDGTVQSAAVHAYVAFITDNEGNEPLIRQLAEMIPDVLKVYEHVTIAAIDDDAPLQHMFDLATTIPKQLAPYFRQIFELCLTTASSKDNDENYRQSSMELMVLLCERTPTLIHKEAANFIEPLVQQCFSMMTELGHVKENIAVLGKTLLCRIARALGPKLVFPPAYEVIETYIQSPNWEQKHTGIVALSAIGKGCKRQMEPHIHEIVDALLPLLKDEHPRVRYAACSAIGQMSSDFGPTLQKKCHEKVIVALLEQAVDLATPRVSAHALAAFVNFAEDCPKHIMRIYLDQIMEKMQWILENTFNLQNDEKLVLLQVITTIVDFAEEYFAKYYDVLMPTLKYILANCELSELHGRTIECISLIGLAVGRELFIPDVHDIMTELNNKFSKKVNAPYVITAWTRICKVLQHDFEPYLEVVMPAVLNWIKFREVLSTSEVGGNNTVHGMFLCFAREMKSAFAPYVEPVVEFVEGQLRFMFHNGVRTCTAEILPHLFAAVRNNDIDYRKSLWNRIFPQLLDALNKESNLKVAGKLLYSIGASVDELKADIVSDVDLARIVAEIHSQMTKYENRRSDREQANNDEETQEKINEVIEQETDILGRISDLIHFLFLTFKENFVEMFAPDVSQFANLVEPNRLPQNDYLLFIFLQNECNENLKVELEGLNGQVHGLEANVDRLNISVMQLNVDVETLNGQVAQLENENLAISVRKELKKMRGKQFQNIAGFACGLGIFLGFLMECLPGSLRATIENGILKFLMISGYFDIFLNVVFFNNFKLVLYTICILLINCSAKTVHLAETGRFVVNTGGVASMGSFFWNYNGVQVVNSTENVVNKVLNASYQYLEFGYQFDHDDITNPNMHRYFLKLSKTKQEQAEKLLKYQNTLVGHTVLQIVLKPATPNSDVKIKKALQAAINMEQQLNTIFLALLEVAKMSNDTTFSNFLKEQLIESEVKILKDLSDRLATRQSESSFSTISEIDLIESVIESQKLFKDDRTSDYIQRLNAIKELISKFINLVEKENFEQEKQSVLEIAFQILKQCVVK